MTLTYPLRLTDENDYVVFTHRKYRTNLNGGNINQSENAPADASASIRLYMPNTTPQANYGNSWNSSGDTFAGPLGKFKKDALATSSELVDQSIDKIKSDGVDGFRESLEGFGRGTGSLFGKAINEAPEILRQVALEGLSELMVSNKNAGLILGSGKIYNPNIELLYQGPALRNFSFQFTFVPRSRTEANVVSEIIREFKKWSAPSAENGFLCVPHVWEIRYGGRVKSKMNKFKPCAMTNISVQDNSGEDLHTTFEDGTPTSTNIRLNFQEVDIVTRKDHSKGDRGF